MKCSKAHSVHSNVLSELADEVEELTGDHAGEKIFRSVESGARVRDLDELDPEVEEIVKARAWSEFPRRTPSAGARGGWVIVISRPRARNRVFTGRT